MQVCNSVEFSGEPSFLQENVVPIIVVCSFTENYCCNVRLGQKITSGLCLSKPFEFGEIGALKANRILDLIIFSLIFSVTRYARTLYQDNHYD